ncbi:MAG: carbohydrate porin [Verrucomicrobiales bacterium]|nr:carbohydrate porin [Verrucomicrobiales bacterium]
MEVPRGLHNVEIGPAARLRSALRAILLGSLLAGQGSAACGDATPPLDPVPEATSPAATATDEARAEESLRETSKPVEATAVAESPDTVQQTLLQSLEWQPGIIGNRVAQGMHRWWTNRIEDLNRKTGIRLSVDYNFLFQQAWPAGDIDLGSAGEFRFTSRWNPRPGSTNNPGFLDFQVRYRHATSEIPPSALGRQIGSLWPTTRGFNDVGVEISHFYYEQYLVDERIGFRLGQSRIDNVFDVHALRDQRRFFLNPAFSANPAVADPAFGLVGVLMTRPLKNLKVSFGATDANSQQFPYSGQSGVGLDDLYYTGQIGWRPRLSAAGDTLLQAMVWRREESRIGPEGSGFSVLAQHRWPDSATLFLRYSHSEGATVASEFLAGGVGWQPWGRQRGHQIGVAGGWGRPMLQGLRDQYVAEIFYRIHLTSAFDLTPDVQLIIDPSLNRAEDVVAVFGVRGRVSF